jgi:hypothetical protein
VDSREERIAQNEALFREVNERIKQATVSEASEMLTLLCECGDVDCTQMVELPLEDYEDVRRRGERFFLVTGHEDMRLERVIERAAEFVIVEKLGESGDVARDLDPRS